MSKSEFLKFIEEYMFLRRYSKRSIETYIKWIKEYILFHNKLHPSKMHDSQVEEFLTYLVLERNVSPQTQAIALNALSFLYNAQIAGEQKPCFCESLTAKPATWADLFVIAGDALVLLQRKFA